MRVHFNLLRKTISKILVIRKQIPEDPTCLFAFDGTMLGPEKLKFRLTKLTLL